MAAISAAIVAFFVLSMVPAFAADSRASGRFGHAAGTRVSGQFRNFGGLHAKFGRDSFARRFDRPHFRSGGHHHFFLHRHFHFGHPGTIIHRPFAPHIAFFGFGRRYIHVGPSPLIISPHSPIIHGYVPRWRAPNVEGEAYYHRPLISLMLDHREELELAPEQVQDLEQLRHDYQREAIRSEADLRIAEIDMEKLLKDDPVDLSQVEEKLREIERLEADRRFIRIRAIEQGKALLSPEQREKLRTLSGSEQPRFLTGAAPE